MKINIKKQDTNQLTKDLMIVALVINALALVLHLILNMFTGVALITAVTSNFIFILLPIMYLAEDAKKNKKVLHKFSDGPSTPFQRKMSLYSVILLFILLVLLGGPFFETENWRLIWLGALLATGIHFFPYYFVHGKSMIFLGLACVINAAVGYLSPESSLVTIAYIDAFIKLAFGLYLFFLSKPSKA